jgi:hypothetical protein
MRTLPNNKNSDFSEHLPRASRPSAHCHSHDPDGNTIFRAPKRKLRNQRKSKILETETKIGWAGGYSSVVRALGRLPAIGGGE